jgi:hypothetical protein
VGIRFRVRQAYPVITVLVLGAGMVLHGYALLRGREALLRDLFTPEFDIALSVPMTFAAVCYWWFIREVSFRTLADRIAYDITAVYLTGSVPLHVRTVVTWDTHYVKQFPGWYSWFIWPIMLVLALFALRIEFKP